MAYILYSSFHTSILYGHMSSSVADGLMTVFCKTQKPALGCLLAGLQLPARGTQEAISHHTVMGDGLDIGQLYATLGRCQLQQYIMNIHEISYHYLSLQIFYSNGKFCCSILNLILSSPSNAFMVNPIIYKQGGCKTNPSSCLVGIKHL